MSPNNLLIMKLDRLGKRKDDFLSIHCWGRGGIFYLLLCISFTQIYCLLLSSLFLLLGAFARTWKAWHDECRFGSFGPNCPLCFRSHYRLDKDPDSSDWSPQTRTTQQSTTSINAVPVSVDFHRAQSQSIMAMSSIRFESSSWRDINLQNTTFSIISSRSHPLS